MPRQPQGSGSGSLGATGGTWDSACWLPLAAIPRPHWPSSALSHGGPWQQRWPPLCSSPGAMTKRHLTPALCCRCDMARKCPLCFRISDAASCLLIWGPGSGEAPCFVSCGIGNVEGRASPTSSFPIPPSLETHLQGRLFPISITPSITSTLHIAHPPPANLARIRTRTCTAEIKIGGFAPTAACLFCFNTKKPLLRTETDGPWRPRQPRPTLPSGSRPSWRCTAECSTDGSGSHQAAEPNKQRGLVSLDRK